MTQRRKTEDYLRTIYMLQLKASVRGADIAAELKVSRPTVSVRLKELAEEMAERNASLYNMLVRLGVSEDIAARDASSMEHSISGDSYRALMELAAGAGAASGQQK